MKNLKICFSYSKESWLLISMLLLVSCSPANSSEGARAYPKALGTSDEGFTIQALRMIATAQTQAKTMRGSYADFDTLVQAGFLDQRFAGATPNVKGYRFSMTARDSDFFVNADPQTTERQPTTGSRHFYLDSSDVSIHVNVSQSATRNDPTL